MKVIATIISLSLTAMLPAVADQSSSDRASWIAQTLSSQSSGKQVSTSGANAAGAALTAASGRNLSRSVANLFPGVRMRPFVPNRYLPSEHDLEIAQAPQTTQVAQMQTATQQVELPASTVQLARAMAQTKAMSTAQHQLQGSVSNVSYAGGYSNIQSRGQLLSAQPNAQPAQSRSRMVSMQSRINALAPSIPEPMGGNETIGQIRSSLRSNRGGQLIADANTAGGANLYPDIVGPVPTAATANAAKSSSFPLNFLSQKSTRTYASRNTQGQRQYPAQQLTTGATQTQRSKLSYGGFQSYTGKVHVQGPSVRSSGRAGGTAYTSALPTECNIASADCYSTSTTRVASYAPYASSQSSSLAY